MSSRARVAPRPAVLGDALGTVPPDPHGHRNGFFCCQFNVLNNCSYTIMLWQIKINPSYYYSSLCINVVRIICRPADSNECRFGHYCQWRASDCCNLQRGSRNKSISHLFYNFIINPLMAASSNPLQRGSRGWGVFIYGNHADIRENGTSWWGCLCDVCLASNKSSGVSFLFPPEQT